MAIEYQFTDRKVDRVIDRYNEKVIDRQIDKVIYIYIMIDI